MMLRPAGKARRAFCGAAQCGRVNALSLLVFCAALLIVFVTSQFVSDGRYGMVAIAAAVFTYLLFILRHWRASVYLLLGYVLIEGFIVNYFGGLAVINLLKDVQLLTVFGTLVAYAAVWRRPLFVMTPWLWVYLGFALIFLAQVFNPNLPSLVVGVVGVRVTLLFTVCMFIAYWFFQDRQQIPRFLFVHNLLAIPISIFGIVQYFTGPQLLLSISPGFGRAIYFATGNNPREIFFRTISTFASTGGFGYFLIVAVVLSVAYLLVAKTALGRWTALGALLLEVTALLTTGNRGPFVLLFVALLIGAFLSGRLSRAAVAVSLIGVLFLVSFSFLGATVQERFATSVNLETNKQRNIALAWYQLVNSMQTPLSGYGAGRMSSAAYRVNSDLEILAVENQLAKMRYETGLAGFLLFFFAFAALCVQLVLYSLRLRDPVRRTVAGFAAGICVMAILSFPVGIPLDVPPFNFYFWFLIGLVHAIVKLEHEEIAAGPEPVSAMVPAESAAH
jgi:hypothetical protein